MTEEDETYRLLAKGDGFRIGLATGLGGAEPPSDTIEFLVRLFPTGTTIRPEDVERALDLVRKLDRMGYSVCFQEDGWISCEKPMGDAGPDDEARHLQSIMQGR